MCTYRGWDFYKRTVLSEKENRAFGLSGGTMAGDFKDNSPGSFDRIIVMNGPGVSYAGMPTPTYLTVTSTYILPPCGPGGYPTAARGSLTNHRPDIAGSGLNNPTHEPDLAQWAYMRFGELQYFDYMCEWANTVTGAQLNNVGHDPNEQIPPAPYVQWGCVIYGGQFRGVGWANRDLQKAAFWCSHDPTNNPNNPVFSDGTELQKYLLDHADDQARMAMAMRNAADTGPGIWGSQASADYVKASGIWAPGYGDNGHGGSGVAGMQVWQAAYVYGGMMQAALRGNVDAKNFIAAWMNFLDRIANNPIMKGASANAYIHHYGLDAVATIQPHGTLNGGGGQGYPLGITRDEQYCGDQSCFQSGEGATWVPNTTDGVTVTGNAFAMEPQLSTSFHGTGGVPNNGDFLFIYGDYNGSPPLPVVPNEIPSALTQSTVLYYVRDLTNTGIGASHNIRWTFNLALTPGGPAIPITDTCTGNGIGPLRNIWHSGQPSTDEVISNAYICQVRNTVNWIHAIAASPYGHNAIVRFT